MTDPTHAQISSRAHALYLRRGGQPGRALDDWLQAERELRDEAARAAKFSAPGVYGTPPGARPSSPTSSFAPRPQNPTGPMSPGGQSCGGAPASAPTASFAPPLPPAKAPPSPTKPASPPAKPSASKPSRPNDNRSKKKR